MVKPEELAVILAVKTALGLGFLCLASFLSSFRGFFKKIR